MFSSLNGLGLFPSVSTTSSFSSLLYELMLALDFCREGLGLYCYFNGSLSWVFLCGAVQYGMHSLMPLEAQGQTNLTAEREGAAIKVLRLCFQIQGSMLPEYWNLEAKLKIQLSHLL